MEDREQIYRLKINEEYGKLHTILKEKIEKIKLEYAKSGSIGRYAKKFLEIHMQIFEKEFSVIYINYRNEILYGAINSIERKKDIINKIEFTYSKIKQNFESSIDTQPILPTHQKDWMKREFSQKIDGLVQSFKNKAEIEFLESKKEEFQKNEIELSKLILKELYEIDKKNGANIYNIDEIAYKYGETDFHKVQRIVKNLDLDGFVEEHCSKDRNDAKITLNGIRNIESKEEQNNKNEIPDILKDDLTKVKNRIYICLKKYFIKLPTAIKIIIIVFLITIIIIFWELIKIFI